MGPPKCWCIGLPIDQDFWIQLSEARVQYVAKPLGPFIEQKVAKRAISWVWKMVLLLGRLWGLVEVVSKIDLPKCWCRGLPIDQDFWIQLSEARVQYVAKPLGPFIEQKVAKRAISWVWKMVLLLGRLWGLVEVVSKVDPPKCWCSGLQISQGCWIQLSEARVQCLWSFYCTKSGETGDVVGMKNGTIFRAPLGSCRSRIQDKPARFLM